MPCGSGYIRAYKQIIPHTMTPNQRGDDRYSEEQILALERSISPDRFNSYVLQAQGDRNQAIRLYERNTELSEALYGVIQGLEITLRNSMHRVLQVGIGFDDWYDRIHLENLEAESVRMARKAVEGLRKPVTAPRLIAKISFGFWVRLTAGVYEKDLWVPHIHKIFPAKASRKDVLNRLMSIKELRNQIAHHERISQRHLEIDYRDILEAIKWLCPITSTWVKNTNRFETLVTL
jgi:hypothetical protein